MELIFSGEAMPSETVTAFMKQAACIILESEGVTNEDIEISVSFTDEKGIRELNRLYRDIDKVTDVLSFPQFNEPGEIPKAGPVILGDVVICTQQALLQAHDFGHSANRELVYLFVHSIFHLMGYYHMTDDEKEDMREHEESVMNKIGLGRNA